MAESGTVLYLNAPVPCPFRDRGWSLLLWKHPGILVRGIFGLVTEWISLVVH